jgi:hypothetical protein
MLTTAVLIGQKAVQERHLIRDGKDIGDTRLNRYFSSKKRHEGVVRVSAFVVAGAPAAALGAAVVAEAFNSEAPGFKLTVAGALVVQIFITFVAIYERVTTGTKLHGEA